MVKAVWNGVVIAETDDTVVVEGNHYFPLAAVKPGALLETATSSVCPWKGTASYFTVAAGDKRNVDAAWTYKTPSAKAAAITGRVAFWKGVTVS